MATKLVCDICGKPAHRTTFVWDGGTQIDPPSGRTERTGDNLDFCDKCLLETFAKIVQNNPETFKISSKILTEKVGRMWRGK